MWPYHIKQNQSMMSMAEGQDLMRFDQLDRTIGFTSTLWNVTAHCEWESTGFATTDKFWNVNKPEGQGGYTTVNHEVYVPGHWIVGGYVQSLALCAVTRTRWHQSTSWMCGRAAGSSWENSVVTFAAFKSPVMFVIWSIMDLWISIPTDLK